MNLVSPLGPHGLRDRYKPEQILHVYFYGKQDDVSRNALVLRINAHIRGAYSLAQATYEADEELDIAEHYAIDVPAGSVPIDVINRVVADYVEAGWAYSQYLSGKVILARTEIYVQKGRPAFAGEPVLLCAIPAILAGLEYSSTHEVAAPAA